MTVYVNDKKIETYRGAKVESAIRKFDKTLLAQIKLGEMEVLDEWGNHTALSGRVSEGKKLFVKNIKK